jgi:hypothetical protein
MASAAGVASLGGDSARDAKRAQRSSYWGICRDSGIFDSIIIVRSIPSLQLLAVPSPEISGGLVGALQEIEEHLIR